MNSSCSTPPAAPPDASISDSAESAPCAQTEHDRPFDLSQWSAQIAHLKAPRAHGATLIEPPLRETAAIVTANRRGLCEAALEIQGRRLCELAKAARQQLLAAAHQYTRAYRDASLPAEPAAVFLAGHQPEMFHPGVWYKNFVLGRLAHCHRGVAVNLQIDSDAMKTASVRVPGGSPPVVEAIPFDRPRLDMPYEERAILDRKLFDSFADRAAGHLQPIAPEPLLKKYWPLATERARAGMNLGASLAQARHQLEGQWGLDTLELPQSQVCDLPAVRWFLVHLLANLPRLWEIYNAAIAEYRQQHHVRSASHPAPELTVQGDWLEAPFWIWSANDPRRRRLFVRQQNDELVLSDRGQIEIRLSITADGDATRAIEQLAAASARGIRIRTRALITTLAARLLLGDLFVHGIGGAKYDQLTDRLIERFIGLRPPAYLVVSGTLNLPHSENATGDDVNALQQRIRDLTYHPERFLQSREHASTDGLATALVEEKRHWIAVEPTAANAKTRCQAIRRVNEALQPAVAPLRQQWLAQLEHLAEAARNDSILASRDYAFVLFPELSLTNFFAPILAMSAGN